MPLNIVSNFASNIAQRNLGMSDAAATSSLAKLSSGSRVVSAKDDAASLAIGSRLNAEVVGLKQAAVNAGQASSMLQIADGAMAKTNDILVRMKSLSVQAGSGQLSATERAMLDTEYQALVSEVDRISNDTDFAGTSLVNGAITSTTTATNSAFDVADGVQDIVFRGDTSTSGDATIAYDGGGNFSVTVGSDVFTGSISSDTNDGSAMSTGTVVTLTNTGSTNKVDIVLNTAFDVDGTTGTTESLALAGSSTTSFTFKVGTGTSSTADDISVSVNSVSASALSIGSTSVTTEANADAASVAISNAIDDVQTYRATIGANQNRLEFAAANIATATENTEAARSQLLDLDVASEMSNFTSKQILIQAGVSMLAQANQLPQNLMRLFN
ncbi:MAG: flagellin [Alphaproteobacteria bacterium]|nr:flagellin [Alphaproteobacteria bacterium]